MVTERPNTETGIFYKQKNRVLEFTAVVLLLLLHFWLIFTASERKSPVFDESLYITGGFSYWHENDYRINPENGNFLQRWIALPLMFQKLSFPDLRQIPLAQINPFEISSDFIYKSGNSPEKILMFSRAMITILSMITGLAVYLYSKKVFGTGGGLLSLALYILCPEILAHAGFATSDLAVTMAFTLALVCIWNVLNRITFRNIIFSSMSLSLLFLTKFSAFIIVPVYIILIFIRLRNKKYTKCVIFSRRINIDTQAKQLLSYSAVLLVNLLLILFFIWMSYGFRFSALNSFKTADRATLDKIYAYKCKSIGIAGNALLAAKKVKILPEAYLYGFTSILNSSSTRNSYLNGELSNQGWWYFFIYSFFVKTPVPLLLIFAFSLFAVLKAGTLSRDKLYMLTPFLIFILIYLLIAISSRSNVGNRHLLPIYPCIFIICGAAYTMLCSKLPVRILMVFLIAWFAFESYKIRPHYLAYFNQLAGGPENGYKHLSDSSLDWGQDLKELRKWIDRNNQKKEDVYLSYFGTADIDYYIRGYKHLPCIGEKRKITNDFFELKPGIYCISATMFQFTYFGTGLKKYTGLTPTDITENLYTEISLEMAKYFKGKSAMPDTERDSAAPLSFRRNYEIYNHLRFAKLCLHLRLQQRKPDAYAGYSILIFRLTDREIKDALSK
jgi:hypothetical protein